MRQVQTENIHASEEELFNHLFVESLGSKRRHLLDALAETGYRLSWHHLTLRRRRRRHSRAHALSPAGHQRRMRPRRKRLQTTHER